MANTKIATCFCGSVEVEVEGDPLVQGYCHCTSCRRWTAQPFMAYALWPSAFVRIKAGAEHLGQAPRNANLTVHFCNNCGGSIMAVSTAVEVTDVFPMIINDFDFQPSGHVNYAERVMDVCDGLPKYRDMPDRAGGSGELMPE